jgi:hypothetical protein
VLLPYAFHAVRWTDEGESLSYPVRRRDRHLVIVAEELLYDAASVFERQSPTAPGRVDAGERRSRR